VYKVEVSLTMSEVFLKVYKIFCEFKGENGYEIKEENVCWAIGYKMAENYARKLLKNKGETDQNLNKLFEKGFVKYEKYSVKVEDMGDYSMICQSHIETQLKLKSDLKNVPLYTFRISIPERVFCKGVFISDKRTAEFYILGRESILIHVKTVLIEIFGIEKRKANYIVRRYKDDLLTQSLFHIFVPSAKITSKKEGTIDLTKYLE
jgi:hypothetical protein